MATVPDLERVSQRTAIPADCAVEVTAFPTLARETLALQVQTLRRLSASEAAALVASVPFVIADGQTRGQAEELMGVLQRERIEGRIVPMGKAD